MNLQEALARIDKLEKELELSQLVADNTFEAIGVFDENMQCVVTNKEIKEVLGYRPDEVKGRSFLDFINPAYHDEVKKNVGNAMPEPYYVWAKRKNGTTFPAEIRGKTTLVQGKRYRISSLRDITFLEATNNDLKAALHEMNIIFTNTKVGLMFLMGGRYIRKVNQTLADIFGYESTDEMKGMDIRKLHLSSHNYVEFGENYFAALAEGAQLNIEYQLRQKDGSPVWCSLSGQAVDTESPINLEKGVLWVVDDISERKDKEAHLIKLATTDDLTGALMRSEFFRLADQYLNREKRTKTGPAMLMIDIDEFKKINDNYGHEAGDAVLREFAEVCRKTLRDNDLFARVGGEEFAVLLPATNLGGAILVAERLRKSVAAKKVSAHNGGIHFTASIGVASTGSKPLETESLLRMADKALYDAKQEGRNKVVFYD